MKKASFSVICLLIFTVILISGAIAAEGLSNFVKSNTYQENTFVDVKPSDWYAENVKTAFELGLMNGKSGSNFGSVDNIKLSETIAMASRLNSIYYTGTDNFVQGAPWYTVYVDYAVANGIISADGYTDYEQFATRRQFAEIFAAALPDGALSAINKISDGAIIDLADEGANAAVYKLYRAGVLTGKGSDGSFWPDDNIQRSECAAIVTRMAKENLRKTFELTPEDQLFITGEKIKSTVDSARQSSILAIECFNLAVSKFSTEFDTTVGAINETENQLRLVAQYIKDSAALCKNEEKFNSVCADLEIAEEYRLMAAKEVHHIPTISLRHVDWNGIAAIMVNLDMALQNAQKTVASALAQK